MAHRIAILVLSIATTVLSLIPVVDVQPLIIQGQAAGPNEYEFMAQIRIAEDSRSHCGGSLIAERFILTAAHCAKGIPIHYVLVNYYYNVPNATVHTKEYRVKKVTIHDQYSESLLIYDYAMIELYEPVQNIKPVGLPSRDGTDDVPGTKVTAIGYGVTKAGDKTSASLVLKEDEFILMDRATCEAKMKRALRIKAGFDSQDTGNDNTSTSESRSILAGIKSLDIDTSVHCINSLTGNSPCYGDSGGPLLIDAGTSPKIVGIASWLAECGVADFPTVYARVTTAASFIDQYSSGHVWSGESPEINEHLNNNTGASTSTSYLATIILFIVVVVF